MKHFLHRSMIIVTCLFLVRGQVWAQSSSYLGVQKFNNNRGSEYVSGNQPGTVLMKVNLWGAVGLPGIHHIPIKTDLISLLSYAEGPTDRALLDDVIIKREIGNQRKLIKVDVEELISGVSHHQVELAPNDVIVVRADKPWVSDDTYKIVAVLSMVMSTALAAVLISQNND